MEIPARQRKPERHRRAAHDDDVVPPMFPSGALCQAMPRLNTMSETTVNLEANGRCRGAKLLRSQKAKIY